uniref:Uncharacterized protein n=1 Tax=Solanum lycopersicum TaxID=4081 RepID=A0A3Q7HHW8_SOLLC
MENFTCPSRLRLRNTKITPTDDARMQKVLSLELIAPPFHTPERYITFDPFFRMFCGYLEGSQ